MKPCKQHHGLLVTVRALPGTPDEGTEITGRYDHEEQSSTFGLLYFDHSAGRQRRAVLDRSEWNVKFAS